jgi:hypothetical protein
LAAHYAVSVRLNSEDELSSHPQSRPETDD